MIVYKVGRYMKSKLFLVGIIMSIFVVFPVKATNIIKLGTGRQDLADFMVKSFGSAKNTQPMWDYVKLETTGRKIGQKPE